MAVKAVQYVRMSTDRQSLSIETQKGIIAAYAMLHDTEVVQTYADDAKSGVTLAKRKGMQQLLRDVASPGCRFNTILVLDVSRWGRFQDVDEGAYYEYHCRLNGVSVVYVQEQFGSPTVPLENISKQLKRVMAGEYSRELGVKVRAGQVQAIKRGFVVGELPALGLRRLAVSEEGQVKRLLEPGERKPLLTDRVRWVWGPPGEVKAVQRIFEDFAAGVSASQIARCLMVAGTVAHDGTPIGVQRVRELLRNEIFVGRYSWGGGRGAARSRTSGLPVFHDGMVEPMIEMEIWGRVRRRMKEAIWRYHFGFDDNTMLDQLRTALKAKPSLTSRDFIASGLPDYKTFTKHFGSLQQAYRAAGRDTDSLTFKRAELISKALGLRRSFLSDVEDLLQEAGISVYRMHCGSTLSVEGTQVKVALANTLPWNGAPRWYASQIALMRSPGRWLLILRLNEDGNSGKDFFLIPPAVHATFKGTFSSQTLPALEPYRLTTGATLVEKLRRLSN